MNTRRVMALMRGPGLVLLGALAIGAGVGAPAAWAADYVLLNSVMGGGGGLVTGGGHRLVGTVGQYAVGSVEGGGFSLMSGIGHDVHGVLWTEVNDGGQEEAPVPKQCRLDQNFPNPFNPTTTIRFALSERTNVDLSVYNILGQSVETLVNGEMDPGEYDVTLDASNLPTGVYFYRIAAGTFVQSRKLVILK